MTKKMLISLKESLSLMLTEKNKKYNYIKHQNESSKKKAQKILFYSLKDFHNKDEFNKLNPQTCSFIFEKNQLELLNFQIKNEIEKIKFLLEQNEQNYSLIKSAPSLFKANREIFCNNNYESITKISGILKRIIREVRKEFIEVVKDKTNKELEINGISLQINCIKDIIEDYTLKVCKKYIETKDIIDEESKEYTNSFVTNQSKRNSISISNKNKTMKKERIIKDKLQNNNIFYVNKNNRDILGDINSDINNNNNQVNNYLNMNIFANFNNIDEKYEKNFGDNKIFITSITTNENINKLNSRNNSIYSENNNEESFISDINENN